MPVVKIAFKEYNRTYTVGIKTFLESVGITMTDEQIQKAVNIALNSTGAPDK